MAIVNGSVASADDVMNAFGLIFSDNANLIWDAESRGAPQNVRPDYSNTFYSALLDNTDIDTTNSDIDDAPAVAGTVLDTFSTGTIDTTIWSTSGTVTETGGYAYFTGTVSYIQDDGVSGVDFNQNCAIFLDMKEWIWGGSHYCKISLIDESANEVDIWSMPEFGSDGTSNPSGPYYVRLYIDPASNDAGASDTINGTNASPVDVTSLTDGDAWHLKISGYGESGTLKMKVGFVKYVTGSNVSQDFITNVETSTETITNAILATSQSVGPGASITHYLSADNGANYEEVTPNEIHRFTNTGTQLKYKATMQTGTSFYTAAIFHYAVKYNLY